MSIVSRVDRFSKRLRKTEGETLDVLRFMFVANDEGGGSEDWQIVDTFTARIVPERTGTEDVDIGSEDREIVEYTTIAASGTEIQRGDVIRDSDEKHYNVLRVRGGSPNDEKLVELEDREEPIE